MRRFERIGLEAGRRALIRKISLYKKTRGHKITVVFDGWLNGPSEEEREREGGILIIYSKKGEKADEVIKRIVRHSSEEILVVTSDRELANAVQRAGAAAIPSHIFEERMEAGPRGNGETEKEEDDRPSPGTRKKGPSKRASRREKMLLTRMKKL